jgi:hypothetical protein
LTGSVSADAVISEVQARVRERLRQQLLDRGASPAFQDPAVFAEVERLLQAATRSGDLDALVLPELLGDPDTWRLRTAIRYESHRGTLGGNAAIFVKRRLLMPVFRWMFEYSRDNFERQRRVNQVLFACVQELAAETARLRQELQRQAARNPADQ